MSSRPVSRVSVGPLVAADLARRIRVGAEEYGEPGDPE